MRYSPAEVSSIKTPNSKFYFTIHRRASDISLINSYLDSNFDVIEKGDNIRYANGNDTSLVNLGPIASFSIFN